MSREQALVMSLIQKIEADSSRLRDARLARDYYDLNGHRHVPRRPGETEEDWRARPKRTIGLTLAAVDALTRHLYFPGPIRSLADSKSNECLQEIYSLNHINSLMQSASVEATMHGACAIEVHPTDDLAKPIRLDVYGGDEFSVWTPPDDPNQPIAVATIAWDASRDSHTYTVWTDEKVLVVELREKESNTLSFDTNPYGFIPFGFFHRKKVVRDFWEGGIGHYLYRLNKDLDRELSDCAQQSQYAIPVGWTRNTAASSIVLRPGYFNRLLPERGGDPEIGWTKPEWDGRSAIDRIEKEIYLYLEMIGIPRTAVQVIVNSGISGIAILAERLPLYEAAKRDQPLWSAQEADLADVILRVASIHYGLPHLMSDPSRLSLYWPESPLSIPMPERDATDKWMLDAGLTTREDILMGRYGLSRDEASRRIADIDSRRSPTPPTQGA